MNRFKTGDRVFHCIFGKGVVLGAELGTFLIKFEKLDTFRNILMDFTGIVKMDF